jgi:hypothetical protein
MRSFHCTQSFLDAARDDPEPVEGSGLGARGFVPRWFVARARTGRKLVAGSRQLEAGSWELEAGSRELEAGGWKQGAGSWELK